MESLSNLHLRHLDSSELSSPTSYSISCSSSTSNFVSDEDLIVMLASSNPKKRAGRIKFKETRHPVSPTWRLPIPVSSDVKDIHRAEPLRLPRCSDQIRTMKKKRKMIWWLRLLMARPPHCRKMCFLLGFWWLRLLQPPPNCQKMFLLLRAVETEDDFAGDDYFPEMLADMAEGLMLSPPHSEAHDDLEFNSDMFSWSY